MTAEIANNKPNEAKLKSFSIREFNIIKRSNSDKIIIIGEDMANRVSPSKEIFNRIFKNTETFPSSLAANNELQTLKQTLGRNLTESEVKLTLMYQENLNWIKNKLLDGYNIIDIGPKTPSIYKSPFYKMERSLIYSK